MADWLTDGFVPPSSPQNIDGRTADTGQTWSVLNGTISANSGLSGAAGSNTANTNSFAQITTLPPSTEQRVKGTLRPDNVTNMNGFGLLARMNGAGTAGYAGGYNKAGTCWQAVRVNASNLGGTLLGSATATLANSTDYSVELNVTGTGATVNVQLKVGGVEVVNYDDTSGSRITDNGYVGFYANTSVVGHGPYAKDVAGENLGGAALAGAAAGVAAATGDLTAPGAPSGLAGNVGVVATATGALNVGAALAGAAAGVATSTGSLTVGSSGGALTRKLPTRFADRIKEISTSTSSVNIALSGTAPQGYRTFASVFAVGSTSIPVYFGDAPDNAGNEGLNWMICECTLTSGTNLQVDSIFSSSNGGAAPTFSAGPKVVFCVLPAARILRRTFVDACDGNFAIDPRFIDDSTQGIRDAIQTAYDSGIERVVFGPGRYKIAAGLGSSNHQIAIPNTREALPNRSIYIEGANPPNFEQQGLRNVLAPDNGTIFESTLVTAAASQPAVFGGMPGNPADTPGWIWNYTNFSMINCGVRTRTSSGVNKMCALNLKNFAQVPRLDMLRIDVDSGLLDMASPNGGSYGILLPPVNNHALFDIGMVYISGYNTGMTIEEHTRVANLVIVGCINGIEIKGANHSSSIGQYSAEHVANAFVMNGNHSVNVQMYDAEHNTAITWCTFATDINYITGNRKLTITHSHIVRQSFGVDDAAFVSSNAGCYKILFGAGANAGLT